MSQAGGRTLRVTLAWALLTLPSGAQTPATTQEISTRDAPATFTSRVNLVSVPVVVRDRQGRAVGTLSREDFQLFDKGKPQVIAKFSVEKSGTATVRAVSATDGNAAEIAGGTAAPVPALPERFVAYLFDDVHLDAGDLLRVRAAAERHLLKNLKLESTTRAAIYTTSGLTTVDFTDDQDKLREALNRIHPAASMLIPGQNCPDVSYFQADQIQNKRDDVAFRVAVDDAAACSGVTDATVLQALAQQSASVALRAGEAESRRVLDVTKDLIRRMTVTPGSRSIVLVSPGFFLTTDHFTEETDLIDRAIRANVTIGALDARGLFTVIPGGNASQAGNINAASGVLKFNYERQAAMVSADILAELAENTGGKFFHNDNGLEEGLDSVAARPEYIYVLAFSPQNLRYDGGYHKLKVTVKDSKTLDAQARRGYYAPKQAADPEEQAKEEISEAVFSRDEIADLSADLNLQFFKTGDFSARLAVLAHVDLKQLHFRKAEDRNKNTLTIVSGLFDRNGNFVSGIQKVVEFNMRDQTMENLPASGITVRSNFDVSTGNYVVRLVVRDSEGQTMAARNGVVQIP